MKMLLTGACLVVLTSFALGQETTVDIGVVLPLSGRTSSYGVEALKGINLAVNDINSQGGARGLQLNLLVKDNAGDPTRTSQEIQQLIADKQVIAIIGPVTSTNSAAAAAVAEQLETPLVLPLATSPYVTEISEYVFRICFTDPFQSKALAKFSRSNLKSENVAIIYESGSSYSEILAQFFSERFQDMGGAIVYSQSFRHDSSNLGQLIDEALSKEPDLLFLPVYYQEAAEIVSHVNRSGSKILLLGGDGWESPEFFRLTEGEVAPGQVFISSHFSPYLRSKSISKFVEAYQRTYDGGLPQATSALGYDAAGILAEALGRATILNRDGVRQALTATDDFHGATGPISINEKRNVVKDVYILKAVEDHFAFETVITSF